MSSKLEIFLYSPEQIDHGVLLGALHDEAEMEILPGSLPDSLTEGFYYFDYADSQGNYFKISVLSFDPLYLAPWIPSVCHKRFGAPLGSCYEIRCYTRQSNDSVACAQVLTILEVLTKRWSFLLSDNYHTSMYRSEEFLAMLEGLDCFPLPDDVIFSEADEVIINAAGLSSELHDHLRHWVALGLLDSKQVHDNVVLGVLRILQTADLAEQVNVQQMVTRLLLETEPGGIELRSRQRQR